MNIISAKVRNYRTHRELSVSFSGNPTLIAGPNESGKSTLIEALHRGLFLKAKIGGEALKHMQSDHGGHPEVEIDFETAGGRWTMRKHFSPTRSSTVLEAHGKPAIRDDEAEERLAEILGVDAAISGGGALGRLDRRWAHVWVRQGASGKNPAGDLEDHQGDLVARLQAMGGAAAVQSELDSQIHQSLKAESERLLKAHNEPRAGTLLHELQEKLRLLEGREMTARHEVARLDGAVAQMDEAEQVVTEKNVHLAELHQRLLAARQRLEDVKAERRKLDPVLIELQKVEQESKTIQRHIEEITAAAASLPRLLNEQTQAVERAAKAEADLATSAAQLTDFDNQLGTVREDLEKAYQYVTAAQAQRDLLDRQQQAEELGRQHVALAEQSAALESYRTEMQRLPQVTAKALAGLRALQQEKVEAESNLRAIATRVEVLTADRGLHIQGQSVEVGASESYSGSFDVEVGDSLHLRVTPGGGESLSDAITQRDEAVQKFDNALIKLEVTSLEQAELLGVQRADLDSTIRAAQKALDASEWEGLMERLESSLRNQAAAAAKADRFREILPHWKPASDERLAIADEEKTSAESDQLKVQIKGLESSRGKASARHAELSELRAEAAEQSHSASMAHSKAQAIQGTLEGTYGSVSSMAENLTQHDLRRSELEETKNAIEQRLEELQADEVEAEIAMLENSQKSQGDIIQKMREQKAAAAALLQSAGTTDPVGDLVEIIEGKRQVELQHAAETRRVQALLYLVSLFSEREAALEHAFTRPLLEKVGGYLAVVFGAGAKAEARYQNGQFDGISLNRSAQGLGTHGFEQLSGGAKEQLGVAFRLAVAEILAAEHDGCLPLVLDDAFTNSDPERVKSLQLMIHRASQRGVQVILLTCTPADYAGLGAHEVRLARPRPGAPVTSPQPSEVEPQESEVPSVALPTAAPQPGDEEAFLTALIAVGGRAGNQSLRESLGWDEARYERVKGCLIDSGKIEKGKGKGGSVQVS